MQIREQLQNEWASTFIEKGGRGILYISPRAGKIKCSINILNLLPCKNPRIIISYPDNKIKASWEKDFEKFEYGNDNIIFINNSSLEKCVDEKPYIYIIDECHSLSENELKHCKSICSNSRYVLALSGTVNKETEQILKNFLQLSILVKYSIEEAIRDGLISNYQINIHSIPLDGKREYIETKGKYITEKKRWDNYTYLINKFQREGKDAMFLILNRNRLLQNSIAKKKKILELLAEKQEKRILIFTGLQKVAEGLQTEFYHSNSENEDSFNKFMNLEINHLALANIGNTGTTFPELDEIILSNFTWNSENSVQTLARALVLDYKDKIAHIHIICSTEEAEIKKLKNTLKDLNQNKIIWIK